MVGRDPLAGGRNLIDILVVGRDPIILGIGMNHTLSKLVKQADGNKKPKLVPKMTDNFGTC